MDLQAQRSETRFRLMSRDCERDWSRRPGQAATRLLPGADEPCERKSVEPMAALTAPERTAAQHSTAAFRGEGRCRTRRCWRRCGRWRRPAIERHGPIEAWIVDDTGSPEKGTHSVGVARQYRGQLGKQDNCQVAVSLSSANRHASLPVAYLCICLEAWASDAARRIEDRCAGGRSRSRPSPDRARRESSAACAVGLTARRGADGRWLRHPQRSAQSRHGA